MRAHPIALDAIVLASAPVLARQRELNALMVIAASQRWQTKILRRQA